MRLLLATAMLLMSAGASLAYKMNVEHWEIRYFPEVNPTGCIMGGNYVDGTRLSVIVTTQYEWALSLSNPSWNLLKDSSADVALYVDGRPIGNSKATNYDRTIVVVPLTSAEPYRSLQSGQRLDVQYATGNLNFALSGITKAMYALLDCVKTLSPPPTDQDYQIVTQGEAAVMLTNLFNTAGTRGYRLTPPKPTDGWIEFGLADGTIGYFRAARGLGTKSADDFAGYVISRWSALCKGDFLSGKQSVPSSDGSVVRKVVTTCRADGKEIVSETTIVRQVSGFLLELTQLPPISTAAAKGGAAQNEDRDRAALVNAAMRMHDVR